MRGTCMRSRTTTSASSNTLSVAALSPASQCQMRLSVWPSLSVRRTGRVILERLEGVDDGLHGLVVDLDRGDPVGGRVARRGDDGRDLLRLVHDGVRRQHHLRVRHERRHPVQVVRLEILPGEDGEHAGDFQRLARVDAVDLPVRDRAADDVEPQHVREDDVVDVVALALQEARILLALHGVAHAADVGGSLRCHQLSSPASAVLAASLSAAYWTAFTMFT